MFHSIWTWGSTTTSPAPLGDMTKLTRNKTHLLHIILRPWKQGGRDERLMLLMTSNHSGLSSCSHWMRFCRSEHASWSPGLP